MRASIGWVLTLASLGFAAPALAGSNYWTNATGDSLWSDPGNWQTGTVPTSIDNVFFDPSYSNGGGVVDLTGKTVSVGEVMFKTTANNVFQLQNGTLITSVVDAGVGEQLISVNLSTTSGNFYINSVGNAQYSGVIGGNGVASDNFTVNVTGGSFSGANTYTGATYVTAYYTPVVLTGANGSIRQSTQIYVSGILELDNRTAVNNDRVGDSAPISSLAGTITLDGNSTVATSESLGAVTISGTKLNLNAYSNGAPAALSLNSLTRSGEAVLELSLASSAGATPGQILVQNAASLPLIGGGGAAGSTNQSILPYAMGDGSSFLTYDAGSDGKLGTADDVGLRPLDISTEYLPAIPTSGPSTSNVRITANQALSQNATINALAISNATLTIPNSQQLQLTSGALSLSGASAQMTAVTGGSLNFSAREGVIYTQGSASGTQPRYVVDSQLQNASTITKFGAGTLVLTKPSSFAGAWTIQEGLIASQTNGALGSGNIVIGGTQDPNAVPAGIAFETANQTFSNSISAVGGAGPITINVASGINVDYSGMIDAVMAKGGPGTLTLTPDSTVGSNGSYIYGLHSGTLRVDTAAHVTINVADQLSPSATLGGSGSIDRVQLEMDGILWPGAGGQNGSDILSISSLQTFVGTFHVSLNGTTAGTQYDQIDIAQYANIFSTNLEVGVGYDARPGDQFMVIDNLGNSQIFGTFANLPEGSTFSADGDQFQITYQGGDGNDVVLTVLSTPEPSATAFATACLAGLLLRRRARRVA